MRGLEACTFFYMIINYYDSGEGRLRGPRPQAGDEQRPT